MSNELSEIQELEIKIFELESKLSELQDVINRLSAENIKLKQNRDILLVALIECDEAMDYISEWDIPIALPERVKEAISQAKGD